MFDEPEHSAIKLKSRPNAGTATRRGAERTKGEVAMIMPVVSRRSFSFFPHLSSGRDCGDVFCKSGCRAAAGARERVDAARGDQAGTPG